MEQQQYYSPRSSTRSLFNLSVIATLLLIGFSVFYYLVIFLPGKEKDRVEQQRSESLTKETRLNSCFNQAYDSYVDRWNSTCKLDGLKEKCSLPTSRSELINTYHKDLKDECFKKYPQ